MVSCEWIPLDWDTMVTYQVQIRSKKKESPYEFVIHDVVDFENGCFIKVCNIGYRLS